MYLIFFSVLHFESDFKMYSGILWLKILWLGSSVFTGSALTDFKWSIIVPVHRPNIGKWRCPWESGGDTTSAYRARFWMKFQTALVERFCVFQRCLPGHQISDWEPQSEFGSWSWEPQSKSKLEPQKALRYLGGGDTKWAPAVAATAVN